MKKTFLLLFILAFVFLLNACDEKEKNDSFSLEQVISSDNNKNDEISSAQEKKYESCEEDPDCIVIGDPSDGYFDKLIRDNAFFNYESFFFDFEKSYYLSRELYIKQVEEAISLNMTYLEYFDYKYKDIEPKYISFARPNLGEIKEKKDYFNVFLLQGFFSDEGYLDTYMRFKHDVENKGYEKIKSDESRTYFRRNRFLGGEIILSEFLFCVIFDIEGTFRTENIGKPEEEWTIDGIPYKEWLEQ